LVDVCEEFLGRELNDISERRGIRDEETAINQLCEVWLVARINFDDTTSSITNVTVMGLTQETHFEKGTRKFIIHQVVADWKSIRSDDHTYMKRITTNVRRIARCMPCVDHEPTAKNIKMINIGITQTRITNLEIR
jgi:hypothetical protein